MRVQEHVELGQVLGRIQNGLAPAFLLSLLITLLWGAVGFGWLDLTALFLGLLALPVVIMGWVNMSVSYGRFAAAESAWSGVMAQITMLGHRLNGCFSVEGRSKKPAALRDRMLLRLAAVGHALRGELRGVHALDDLAELLEDAEFDRIRGTRTGTLDLSAAMRADVRAAHADGRLSDLDAAALQDQVDQLLHGMAQCRQLATTHAPPILTRVVPMISMGFCVFLPLGLVTTTGWLTPIATLVGSAVFLVPNAIAASLSTPYGAHPDCLPLYRDCRVAETQVRGLLGQDALPRSIEPFGGVIR